MSHLHIVVKKPINLLKLCVSQRCYSVFPTHYVKPIYNKEDLQNLRVSKEIKEVIHKCFRPALTTDSSSEFHDETVKRFTNYIMRKGKKELARNLLNNTFENIKLIQIKRYHKANPSEKETIEVDPKVIFHKAIENVTPILELRRHTKGGINYKVPVAISESRAKFLAMNWLIQAAKMKETKVGLPQQLAKELIDAFNKTGRVIMRKQDLHKECDANRAYAHFRWMKK
ncbi:hypothetical protein M0802_003414 [Mischocyttarus mexicanus]|nr:hypothetical protein M0802_003414 [Mischocyttarus mexicanus]